MNPPRGSEAHYEAKAEREAKLADGAWEQWFRHAAARDSYRTLARLANPPREPGIPETPRSKSGVPITDQLAARLAEEAERGYGLGEQLDEARSIIAILARRLRRLRLSPLQ